MADYVFGRHARAASREMCELANDCHALFEKSRIEAPARAPMAETAIQFLERWREAYVYPEPRALKQLDETVIECAADGAEAGISADGLQRAAGGHLKECLRTAIIDTSE
jgi:hypothetical protein